MAWIHKHLRFLFFFFKNKDHRPRFWKQDSAIYCSLHLGRRNGGSTHRASLLQLQGLHQCCSLWERCPKKARSQQPAKPYLGLWAHSRATQLPIVLVAIRESDSIFDIWLLTAFKLCLPFPPGTIRKFKQYSLHPLHLTTIKTPGQTLFLAPSCLCWTDSGNLPCPPQKASWVINLLVTCVVSSLLTPGTNGEDDPFRIVLQQ